MSTAQKVRLWLTGGFSLLGMILLLVAVSAPFDHTYVLTDGSTGPLVNGQAITNGYVLGCIAWAILFFGTAIVLGAITLYRVYRPVGWNVRTASNPGQVPPQYKSTPQPHGPWQSAPPPQYKSTPQPQGPWQSAPPPQYTPDKHPQEH